MDSVVIRSAGRQDIEVLCRLYFQFHQYHVGGVPDRLASLGEPDEYDYSELRVNLENIIRDDDSVLFLAQVGQQPAGFAEVYVRDDKPDPARVSYRYGHLQSLMVLDKFRRNGIGTRLVEETHRWAKEQGATEMRLDIWEFDRGPLDFYENAGYRTLRRTLVRGL
jgi:GNAT superfamily N-acetyltransferase